MIEQVSVFLENTAGRLAKLCRALGDAQINMHALMVADTSDFGVVRIICDNPEHAKALLDQQGFGASLTDVIAVELPDRPGALADALEVLDATGINVEYAYCFETPTGPGATDVLKVDDPRAEAILVGAGFRSLGPADLYALDGTD
jgi:hypothetical protein